MGVTHSSIAQMVLYTCNHLQFHQYRFIWFWHRSSSTLKPRDRLSVHDQSSSLGFSLIFFVAQPVQPRLKSRSWQRNLTSMNERGIGSRSPVVGSICAWRRCSSCTLCSFSPGVCICSFASRPIVCWAESPLSPLPLFLSQFLVCYAQIIHFSHLYVQTRVHQAIKL